MSEYYQKRKRADKMLKRFTWRIQYRERKRINKETPIIEDVFRIDEIDDILTSTFINEIVQMIPSEQGKFVIQKIVLEGCTEKEVASHLNETIFNWLIRGRIS